MKHIKFEPLPIFKPFVECYFVWQVYTKEELDVQTPPSCKGAIVINLRDPTQAYSDSSTLVEVLHYFVCGQFTANFHRVVKGKIVKQLTS